MRIFASLIDLAWSAFFWLPFPVFKIACINICLLVILSVNFDMDRY